jgi:ADP-ribosylglycohydrolase
MGEKVRERFRGSLLGLAIGDALGMPVEGARASTIKARLGRVTDFYPAPWRNLKAGQWTDDTKMMLCHARSIVDRGKVDVEDIAAKFVEWYLSRDWRGIGEATYESINRLLQGVSPLKSGKSGEMAAGNGTVMRIAPIALIDCLDLEKLHRDAELASIITHNNPEAVAGSRAVCYAISRAVVGKLRPGNLIDEVAGYIGPCQVSERLLLAKKFLDEGMDVEEALLRLGTSGYVVETVASAFFCFLRMPDDFAETVISAVGGGIDADTTGAVAGSISGAYNGSSGIPEKWVKNVEASQEIIELADRIYTLVFPT